VVTRSEQLDTSTALTVQIAVTGAGTAVQGSDLALKNGCYVYAHPSNTGLTYVGNTSGSVGTATGAVLASGGDGPLYFAVQNLNQLWFNAAVAGEKLFIVKA
jgi:hypothetical protein